MAATRARRRGPRRTLRHRCRAEPAAGGWPKGGVTRLELPNRHLEYALTWYGLAAALLGASASKPVLSTLLAFAIRDGRRQ